MEAHGKPFSPSVAWRSASGAAAGSMAAYSAEGAHAEGRVSGQPLLTAEDVRKDFGGVRALSGVNLALDRGSVHAIIGHNGAGKSTLMNILSGAIQADSGRLLLQGKPVSFRQPREAQARGVSMVHQELSVLEDLDVAENILLGREPLTRLGLVDRPKLRAMAGKVLGDLRLDLPMTAPCSALSAGERQMVEIARAVSGNSSVLIFDEPTAALTRGEQDALFALIGRLKAAGLGILYISHRLDEILLLADYVTVLRDGKDVGWLRRGEFDHASLVETMLGHSIREVPPPKPHQGRQVLGMSGLGSRSGGLQGISLSVAAGEIVGLAGMLGSGRSELLECLFGARTFEGGTITLNGADVRPGSPLDAMAQGIGMVPEDRKVQGIFPGTSLWKNVTLPSIHDLFSRLGFVTEAQARRATTEQAAQVGIRAHSISQDIALLSGGNQQKAILARWMLRAPKLLLLDEPTAGIDVGAKSEIHALIRQLADRGVAVLVASSEFDELIGLCHRILIVRDGQIIGEVDGASATERSLVLLATGGGQ